MAIVMRTCAWYEQEGHFVTNSELGGLAGFLLRGNSQNTAHFPQASHCDSASLPPKGADS